MQTMFPQFLALHVTVGICDKWSSGDIDGIGKYAKIDAESLRARKIRQEGSAGIVAVQIVQLHDCRAYRRSGKIF
jgi:hypothetical protein